MARLIDIPEPERTFIAEVECPRFTTKPWVPAVDPDQRHVAIVSSAGFIVRGQRALLPRDSGYRSIASSIRDKDILCSHVSTNFDRSGFQQDINVMLPRDRLVELEQDGTIGKAADTHYAFMGATDVEDLEGQARVLGQSMLALGVNTVVLAPV